MSATQDQRDQRVQEAVTVILKALEENGFAEDPPGALQALVVAGGFYALASEQPKRAMAMLREAAAGSISAGLLDEEAGEKEATGS